MSTKRTGTVGELWFAQAAMSRGLAVVEPVGDYLPWDLGVVLEDNTLVRVQVKAATAKERGTYHFTMGHGLDKQAYGAEHADVIACVLLPENSVFLIPVELCPRSTRLADRPRGGKWEPYRDNWSVFDTKKPHPLPGVGPVVVAPAVA